jgi:hypothetical protein
MLCPSEQVAYHYTGAAIRDPADLWPSCDEIHEIFKWRTATERVSHKFKANRQRL